MTTKEKAKEIVNSFYQPLGMVKQFQKLNSKQMWKIAQDAAKAQINMRINNTPALTDSEKEYLEEVLKEIDNV